MLDPGEGVAGGFGNLGYDEFFGPLHHFLLPERQRLDQAEIEEALEDKSHVQKRPGFHEIDVLFVTAFPVHGDVDGPVPHEVEDLLDGVLGIWPADAYFFGRRVRDEDEGIVIDNPDVKNLELFPVVGPDLDILDDTDALIGINDLIPDFQ